MRRVAFLALLVSAPASADPPGLTPPVASLPSPASPPEAADNGSYRLQTASADAVALVLAMGSGGSRGALTASLAAYLFAAPIIHGVHGHGDRALASLGLRLGLPVAGAYLGAALTSHSCSSCDDEDAPFVGAILGLFGGALAASVIDTGYLARGEPARPAPTWTPTFSAAPGAMTLGVAGSF